MSQQTSNKANATLDTQDSLKETHKQDSNLVETIPLENGFIVRRHDKKWFTTLGDTVITEPTDNYNGQLEQLDDLNYKVLINIFTQVYKALKKLEETDRMTKAGL